VDDDAEGAPDAAVVAAVSDPETEYQAPRTKHCVLCTVN
jgi:hypothetical protein